MGSEAYSQGRQVVEDKEWRALSKALAWSIIRDYWWFERNHETSLTMQTAGTLLSSPQGRFKEPMKRHPAGLKLALMDSMSNIKQKMLKFSVSNFILCKVMLELYVILKLKAMGRNGTHINITRHKTIRVTIQYYRYPECSPCCCQMC